VSIGLTRSSKLLERSLSQPPLRLLFILFASWLCTVMGAGSVYGQDTGAGGPPVLPNIPGLAPRIVNVPPPAPRKTPSSLPRVSSSDRKIGEVKTLRGKWCRDGSSRLKEGLQLFWKDDIRYCANTPHRVDQIAIIFDRSPPFEETYKCSTPGICSGKERLWLQGAYMYGSTPSGSPDITISVPKLRSAVLPDVVIPTGSDFSALPGIIVAALSARRIAICQVSAHGPHDCLFPSDADAFSVIVQQPALYGFYQILADGAPPSALLLITDRRSKLPGRWASVPEAFRADPESSFVRQRRRFLLDLYENEAHYQAIAEEP
jgi:hypothetical protein